MDNIVEDLKSKYEYLHELSLDEWLWEFIRRNSEYKTIYTELKRDISETDFKQANDAQFTWSEVKFSSRAIADKFDRLEKGFGICPTLYFNPENSDSYLSNKIKGKEHVVSIPNPEKQYNEIKPDLQIRGSKPILFYTFKGKEVKELLEGDKQKFNERCYRAIKRISPNSDIQNTLYIGISLNAKKEDLREYFEEIIDSPKFEPVDTRDRQKKWYFYIIVSDLFNKHHLTFDEIAEKLKQEFPDMRKKNSEESLFNYKTIFNWSATAADLISGKFRKFISLH
jgi:hypothetical protein